MLIVTAKHTRRELDHWRVLERIDRRYATTSIHRRRVERAQHELISFAAGGRCYAGVSWGKDSVCLAHIVATHAPHVPLVWIRIEPVRNPDCVLVRDAFLARHAVTYDEIIMEYEPNETRWVEGFGPQKTGEIPPAHVRGFAVASARHGDRHLSGIRAAESSRREARMRKDGHATRRTCAPLGWWRAEDVFGYLAAHELPVHPAYAYTLHGTRQRERLRVDALWGPTGTGHGRREWERYYYPEALEAMRAWCGR